MPPHLCVLSRAQELYPRWLAPNFVTLTGFACTLTAYGITWANSPGALGNVEPKEWYLHDHQPPTSNHPPSLRPRADPISQTSRKV